MKKTLLAVGTFAVASAIGFSGASALMQNNASMMALVPSVAVPKYPTVKTNSETPPTDPCAAEKAALTNAQAKYIGALERQNEVGEEYALLQAKRINGTFGITTDDINMAGDKKADAKNEVRKTKKEKDEAQAALDRCTNAKPQEPLRNSQSGASGNSGQGGNSPTPPKLEQSSQQGQPRSNTNNNQPQPYYGTDR